MGVYHWLKAGAKATFNRMGLQVSRSRPKISSAKAISDVAHGPFPVTDIEQLCGYSENIPGMISGESGKILYILALMQRVRGDVVEIGSWQGKSTLFLARAARDSGNGEMIAIDHFKGNVGKESFYRVDGRLDNLKELFIQNLQKAGLRDNVKIFDMSSDVAAKKLQNGTVRMLFIDGDHTYAGVKRDLSAFKEKLVPGAIVIFDDYFGHFPGVITAVSEFMDEIDFRVAFEYRHTLVIEFIRFKQDEVAAS